jgi:molybdopterin synthase catalytic subunit
MPQRVFIQTADFDLSHEVATLRADDGGVGAVCVFVGTVRDRNAGSPVSATSEISRPRARRLWLRLS